MSDHDLDVLEQRRRDAEEGPPLPPEVDITGLDKAEVLCALYEVAKPLGFGHLHYKPGPMPIDRARELIEAHSLADGRMMFDYVAGRVLKVDLGGDTFKPWLFDRDNGKGAAAAAIAALRARKAQGES